MPNTDFEELQPQTQEDLINWFNIVPESIDDDDKQLLADLYNNGQFEAWDCPKCGARCYNGTPDNWGAFQGVSNVDHTSYPGDGEKTALWCDRCRCYKC